MPGSERRNLVHVMVHVCGEIFSLELRVFNPAPHGDFWCCSRQSGLVPHVEYLWVDHAGFTEPQCALFTQRDHSWLGAPRICPRARDV